MKALTDSTQRNKYLSIAADGEDFGIPVLRIKEIIEHGGIVRVPMMPAFVRGAINLRGNGVPVIDLAERLCLGHTRLTRRTCIVIVEMGQMDVGLQVDAVNQVFDIAPTEIEPTPTFDGRIRADFLYGMGKVDGRFIVLLDVDAILTLEDYDALRQAASSGGQGEARQAITHDELSGALA